MTTDDALHAALAQHVGQDEARFEGLHERLADLKKSVRSWGVFGGVVGGALAMGVHMLGGCGVPAGRPDPATIASYGAEEVACVRDYSTRATIDACRARARAAWCARWPSEVNCLDAGSGDAHE